MWSVRNVVAVAVLSVSFFLLPMLGCKAGQVGPTHEPEKYLDSPFGWHGVYTLGGEDFGLYKTVPAKVSFMDAMGFKDEMQYFRWGGKELREMGVRWERDSQLDFPRQRVQRNAEEREKGIFHWDYEDAIFGAMSDDGLNILANIGPGPKENEAWGQTNIWNYFFDADWRDPAQKAVYTKFVEAAIRRYAYRENNPRGIQIRYWQVGNEPNLMRGQRPPEQFAEIMQVTYDAIKKACPQCKVVMGGVGGGPVWSGRGSSREMFHEYYEKVFEILGGKSMDVFDYHWYGHPFGDYKTWGAVQKEVRETLDKYGYRNVPIWVTEMGSYSGKPKKGAEPFASERDMARDLIKRYVYPVAIGTEKIFWAWGMVEGFKYDEGYFDFTGVIYDGLYDNDRGAGVRKLAFYSCQVMTSILEGSDFKRVETLSLGDDKLMGFLFRKGTERVYVLWHDDFGGPAKQVKLSLQGTKSREVTVTNGITDEKGARNVKRIPISGDVLSIEVTEDPIFIQCVS